MQYLTLITYPNLILSLTDRNLCEAVTLRLHTHGYNFLCGSKTVAIIYRTHYKFMNTLAPNVHQISSPGKTVLIETNMLTSNIATPRVISWEAVQFPESWNIQQAIPPQPMIHHHIDEIIENSDGDVSILRDQ